MDFSPIPSLSILAPCIFYKTGSSACAKASSLKWDALTGNAPSHLKTKQNKLLVEWTLSALLLTVREMCWLIWLVNFARTGHVHLGLILLSFRNVPFCMWRMRNLCFHIKYCWGTSLVGRACCLDHDWISLCLFNSRFQY